MIKFNNNITLRAPIALITDQDTDKVRFILQKVPFCCVISATKYSKYLGLLSTYRESKSVIRVFDDEEEEEGEEEEKIVKNSVCSIPDKLANNLTEIAEPRFYYIIVDSTVSKPFGYSFSFHNNITKKLYRFSSQHGYYIEETTDELLSDRVRRDVAQRK